MKLLPVLAAGGLAALHGLSFAQTLYVYDGSAAVVREVSGPSDPLFCFYPDGPIVSVFPTPGSIGCPLVGTIGAPLNGDIAVNRPKDSIWVTDGVRVSEYDSNGTPINSFALPRGLLTGDIRGMGFDGAQGTLWLTDGLEAVEIFPAVVPCSVPTVTTSPFQLPQLGPVIGSVTDIDWEPASNTLWVCDNQGNVGNVQPGGALLQTTTIAPGPCGLNPQLVGLTIDTSTTNPGTLYVTDGIRIANIDSLGAPAVATFGSPITCFSVPGGPAHGIGFSARPITYGIGGGVLTPPEMGSTGQAVIQSTNLAITLSNASPGSLAVLPFTQGPLCPALVVATVPVLILPPAFALVSHVVDGTGQAVQPIALPPGTTVGAGGDVSVVRAWRAGTFAGRAPAAIERSGVPAHGLPLGREHVRGNRL